MDGADALLPRQRARGRRRRWCRPGCGRAALAGWVKSTCTPCVAASSHELLGEHVAGGGLAADRRRPPSPSSGRHRTTAPAAPWLRGHEPGRPAGPGPRPSPGREQRPCRPARPAGCSLALEQVGRQQLAAGPARPMAARASPAASMAPSGRRGAGRCGPGRGRPGPATATRATGRRRATARQRLEVVPASRHGDGQGVGARVLPPTASRARWASSEVGCRRGVGGDPAVGGHRHRLGGQRPGPGRGRRPGARAGRGRPGRRSRRSGRRGRRTGRAAARPARAASSKRPASTRASTSQRPQRSASVANTLPTTGRAPPAGWSTASAGEPSHRRSTPATSRARASVKVSPAARASASAPSTAARPASEVAQRATAKARVTATAARTPRPRRRRRASTRRGPGPAWRCGIGRVALAADREVPADPLLQRRHLGRASPAVASRAAACWSSPGRPRRRARSLMMPTRWSSQAASRSATRPGKRSRSRRRPPRPLEGAGEVVGELGPVDGLEEVRDGDRRVVALLEVVGEQVGVLRDPLGLEVEQRVGDGPVGRRAAAPQDRVVGDLAHEAAAERPQAVVRRRRRRRGRRARRRRARRGRRRPTSGSWPPARAGAGRTAGR